jgi:hypothetical protein
MPTGGNIWGATSVQGISSIGLVAVRSAGPLYEKLATRQD